MNVLQMGKVDASFVLRSSDLTDMFSGLTALVALGILDHIEKQGKMRSLLEMEHNSAEYFHVLIESLRSVILQPHLIIG